MSRTEEEWASIEAEEEALERARDAELSAEIARLEALEEAEFEASQAALQVEIERLQAQRYAEDAEAEREQEADRARRAAKKRKAQEKAPVVGKIMRLRKVPTYSRVRIKDWGSIAEVDDEVAFTVDDVVTLWTTCVEPNNSFAAVELRGVLGDTPHLQWLPEDAKVEIVQLPRFAGQPAELVHDLKPMEAPEGAKGMVVTAEGFHPLIWSCDPLFSPVQGWSDPQTSVEVLLCALNVAPDDGILQPQLLSALRARYARVRKDKSIYPPKHYPWRNTLEPGRHLLKYMRG